MIDLKEKNARLDFRVKIKRGLLDINLRISGKWILVSIASILAFLIPGTTDFLKTLLSFL